MSDPEIVSVTGGAGGTEARYEDILSLAGLYDTAGNELRADAWDDKLLLADGDLVASSVLSPLSFADAEAAVIAATVGPDSLAVRAVGIEADALIMQTAVGTYRLADDVSRQMWEVIDYAGGYVLGAALPGLVVVAGLGTVTFLATNPALTAYLATHPEARKALLDGTLSSVEEFLEDHPELVQHLINGGGGLTDGLLSNLPPALRTALLVQLGIDPFHFTTNDAAGELAGLFDDSDPKVTHTDGDRALAQPGSVEDLMRNPGLTNEGGDGEIDIQTVGEPPNQRYIVNLPGTDSWGDDPDDSRDLQGNLQLMAGQDTAYSRGIIEAMERAGIPEDAPVMLVGHSQGGMTATHLAADPEFRSRFDVQHVVTAGAPTAQVPDIPVGTQVLSLENSGDLVPLLDGEDNPDQPNRTTVRFDDTQGSVGANHDMDRYVNGGSAVDSSADPSLTESIAQMREDGFLGDGSSSTDTWTIARDRG